jgi:hypothetical protein
MWLRIVSALAALVGALGLAHASDLPVTYNVQDKPLKAGALSTTPLTFTLFTDAACTQQVYQATLPAGNVTLISRLKLATPKGAAKALPTDQIEATLPGVTAGGNLYLSVTGTGVTASGATCQAQAALDQGALTTVPQVSMVYCGPFNTSNWCPQFFVPPINPVSFALGDRQAAAALQALDPSVPNVCDVQVLAQNGTVARDSNYSPMIFGLANCHALAATCADGLKDGNESAVDCGGSCALCTSGGTCNVNGDCRSNNCSGGVCQ